MRSRFSIDIIGLLLRATYNRLSGAPSGRRSRISHRSLRQRTWLSCAVEFYVVLSAYSKLVQGVTKSLGKAKGAKR